jgi:glycosyltransferase involved in cell wall biosynthesis
MRQESQMKTLSRRYDNFDNSVEISLDGEAGQRGLGRRVLIIVENLPVPFDRRVWSEATTLASAGYEVSVICPATRGQTAAYELLEGVHVHRHPQPVEGEGALGYLREYGSALWHEARLAWKIWRERGFDVIHGCNPPDLIFLVALMFRPLGVRFLFDHHDVCPELYEAKFAERGLMWRLMRVLERVTFWTASVSIATNDSFAAIARDRGGMRPDDVFVVRSAPSPDKFRLRAPDPALRKGFAHLVGYVGVIGQQEGMDLLVAAAEHLIVRKGRRDVHFLIIGFGTQLPMVQADVEARGLGAHFTFTGALYGEDMLRALGSADLCVSPDPRNAMNNISTMNKIIEYMTLEKPVVQFDLDEGRTSAGDAALYAANNDPADFAEKIAQLLDDPALRQRMGRIGRARVLSGLSWDHSAPNLLAAYDRVFAKTRVPA